MCVDICFFGSDGGVRSSCADVVSLVVQVGDVGVCMLMCFLLLLTLVPTKPTDDDATTLSLSLYNTRDAHIGMDS